MLVIISLVHGAFPHYEPVGDSTSFFSISKQNEKCLMSKWLICSRWKNNFPKFFSPNSIKQSVRRHHQSRLASVETDAAGTFLPHICSLRVWFSINQILPVRQLWNLKPAPCQTLDQLKTQNRRSSRLSRTKGAPPQRCWGFRGENKREVRCSEWRQNYRFAFLFFFKC